VRWALWRPWRTLRAPLVWILHAAYAWVPVYLVLRIFAIEGSVCADDHREQAQLVAPAWSHPGRGIAGRAGPSRGGRPARGGEGAAARCR